MAGDGRNAEPAGPGGGADGTGPSALLHTSPRHDGSVAVSVLGEIDMATAAELDRGLRSAQADARSVVVDLQRVPFMDSSGVRVLIEAHQQARSAGARLVILNGTGPAHRTLAATGVDAFLVMADDVDELPPADTSAVEDTG